MKLWKHIREKGQARTIYKRPGSKLKVSLSYYWLWDVTHRILYISLHVDDFLPFEEKDKMCVIYFIFYSNTQGNSPCFLYRTSFCRLDYTSVFIVIRIVRYSEMQFINLHIWRFCNTETENRYIPWISNCIHINLLLFFWNELIFKRFWRAGKINCCWRQP